MNVQPSQKLDLYRAIRSVFVRHWIDIGRLSIRISGSSVLVHGSLRHLPGVPGELPPAAVGAIFGEISRIRGVRRIDADFDNWKKIEGLGTWTPAEDKIAPSATVPAVGTARTFDVGGGVKPDSEP